MVLHLVGLGLNDEQDITVRQDLCVAANAVSSSSEAQEAAACRGLEIVRRCKRVYLEAYTAILLTGTEKLVWLLLRLHCLRSSIQHRDKCLWLPGRTLWTAAHSR